MIPRQKDYVDYLLESHNRVSRSNDLDWSLRFGWIPVEQWRKGQDAIKKEKQEAVGGWLGEGSVNGIKS